MRWSTRCANSASATSTCRSRRYASGAPSMAASEAEAAPEAGGPKPIAIFVDADACPVKPEIYRVAARHGVKVHVVANQLLAVPRDPLIERVAVGSAFDAADDWIAERARRGDIVVTTDIPLASRCVKAGATVIAPTGRAFTEASI